MQGVDTIHRMANYEFFREKAWQTMNCLNSYVKYVPYTYVFINMKLHTISLNSFLIIRRIMRATETRKIMRAMDIMIIDY